MTQFKGKTLLNGRYKNDEKCFLFHLKKLFSFSRDLDFYLGFFSPVKNRLDSKNKVNLKFYDVTIWEKNKCNTHIAQYLQR